MSDAPTDPLVGARIGEYHITRVLGRGGMGVVYEAEDTALGIPVALKSISAALARDAAFVRRFRTEARAMARVASPHIVRVMALRETEEGLFIVMEYVDGGDLHARMAEGPMAWDAFWPLLRQMLLGLEAAHAVGIVHRDIKPRNVLLTRDGTVKLTDFGLARLTADGEATVTQAVAGTLAYMSPEQVRSLPTLDGRSDLFSLGLLTYEALAGRLPFDRTAGEFTVMRSIVETPFPPPTEFAPGVPPGVAHALMRALEKDPDRRYASAADMRDALSSAGDDGGRTRTRVPPPVVVAETPAAPAEAAMEPAGVAAAAVPAATTKRPVPMAALAGGAALVTLLAVGWWATRDRDDPPDDTPIDTSAQSEVPTSDTTEAIALTTAPPAGQTVVTQPANAGPVVQQVPGPVVVQQVPGPAPRPAPGPSPGPAPAPRASTGTLTVSAAPGVTLALDGSGISDGSREVAPGTYAVRCSAGPLSETTRVTVQPGQQSLVQCHAATRTVSVNVASDDAERPWMTLLVDGQPQGQTPAQVTLPVGRHTLSVRRRGYSVVGAETQTVDVPPSFSPSPLPAVSVQFQVRADSY